MDCACLHTPCCAMRFVASRKDVKESFPGLMLVRNVLPSGEIGSIEKLFDIEWLYANIPQVKADTTGGFKTDVTGMYGIVVDICGSTAIDLNFDVAAIRFY